MNLLIVLDSAKENQARGYKTFFRTQLKLSISTTQLKLKFQLLIETIIILKIRIFLALDISDIIIILLINVKMPTIVGILTVMSMINLKLS